MPIPAITLSGNLKDIFGAAVSGGSVVIQLVGFGGSVPRIIGTGILARTAPLSIAADGSGAFSTLIYGNDVITPDTYYVIQILDDQNNVVMANAYRLTIAGGAAQVLSDIVPYNPNVVVAPVGPVVFGQDVILAFNANIVIPGNLGTCFEVTLTGDVISDVMNNVQPGTLYTFMVIQDGVGGRAWVWPANVIDAEPVDPNANRISTQLFIARSNGNLYAVGPMMSR